MSWTFRPPWWATLAVAALCGVMATLGAWQVRRAHGKEALLDNLLAAQTQPARTLAIDTPTVEGNFSRRLAHGEFDAARELLLDNQSLHRRPGRHVWTPLKLESGGLVLVDRGWVGLDAGITPPPAGTLVVEGFWRSLPVAGLRVSGGNCGGEGWPRIVQYPDAADLACLYPDEPVAAGVLLLHPQAPGGFQREWNLVATDVPPARHYAYAAQWFAFTLTLLALYLKLNLKKHA